MTKMAKIYYVKNCLDWDTVIGRVNFTVDIF